MAASFHRPILPLPICTTSATNPQRNMSHSDEDWSDSDEENVSQVETSVLLGVPDGSIDDEADRVDGAVSRIGGLPVRASPATLPYLQNILTYFFLLNIFLICTIRRTRPYYHRVNPQYLPPIANRAPNPWNCLSRCGVPSKTVRWIERCTFGVAHAPAVKAKLAGVCIHPLWGISAILT